LVPTHVIAGGLGATFKAVTGRAGLVQTQGTDRAGGPVANPGQGWAGLVPTHGSDWAGGPFANPRHRPVGQTSCQPSAMTVAVGLGANTGQ